MDVNFIRLYGKLLVYEAPIGIFKKDGTSCRFVEYNGDEIERFAGSVEKVQFLEKITNMHETATKQRSSLVTPQTPQEQSKALDNMVEFSRRTIELLLAYCEKNT